MLQAAIALVFFTRVVVSGMLVLEKTTVESIKSDFKEMFSLALPVVFMSILSQASYIVDRSVASNFDEGTMALIGYASTLALAVHALFSESINNVVYPKLSSYAAKRDSSGFLELAEFIDLFSLSAYCSFTYYYVLRSSSNYRDCLLSRELHL